MPTEKLISLYDAARHPEVKRLGLSRNHLRDALVRGALKSNQADIVPGRHNGRRVYAVSEAALLEFLGTLEEGTILPATVNKGVQPPMVRAAQRSARTASQKRAGLMRLYHELINESREFDMTLEQYLDLIDFDQGKRAELVKLGQFHHDPDKDPDDDREDSDTLLGESGSEESLLCGEEASAEDGDALCLGHLRRMAD